MPPCCPGCSVFLPATPSGWPARPLRHCLRALALSPDNQRSPVLALLGNPVAFLGALGLPLCGLYAHSLGTGLRRALAKRDLETVGLIAASALPLLLAILLGKPRGEAERIMNMPAPSPAP